MLLLTELHLPLRVTLLLGRRGTAGPTTETPSASGHVRLSTWRAIHINASLSYCLLKATPLSSLSTKSFSPSDYEWHSWVPSAHHELFMLGSEAAAE